MNRVRKLGLKTAQHFQCPEGTTSDSVPGYRAIPRASIAPMLILPSSGRLREESPTSTPYSPGRTVHCLLAVSQMEKARSYSVTVTRWVWPGCRLTFVNPFNCFGGSPAAGGAVT